MVIVNSFCEFNPLAMVTLELLPEVFLANESIFPMLSISDSAIVRLLPDIVAVNVPP